MKRLLSLFLALVFMCALAGCAGEHPDYEETTKPEISDYPIVCEFELKGTPCFLTLEDSRHASLSLSQTMTEKNLETIGVDVKDAEVVRTTTATGTYKERRGTYTLTLKKLTLSMEITGDDAEDVREGMLAWYTTHTDDDSAHILEAINGKEVDVSHQLDSSYFKLAFVLEGEDIQSLTVYETDEETVALTYTFHSNGRVKEEHHYQDGKVYKSYTYNRWGKMTDASVANPAPDTKTVYFGTKQTAISPALHSTTEITYDEAGRLTGYRLTRTYPSMDTSSEVALSYVYTDQGTISQITLSSAGESIPMAASYEDGRLVGYYGEYDGTVSGWQFGYNADGQIATVYLVENQDEREVITLDYYDSGALRERVVHDQSYQITTKYNQDGKITEQSAYDPIAGTFLYRNFYEYDAQGNQVRQETYSMGSTEPTSVIQMEYDADGRCIAIEASGEGQSVQADGQWDSAARTMTFALEIDGMEAVMQYTYDDAGHVIRNYTQSGDTVAQENTYEYVALEMPGDYVEPNLLDPVYLLFAIGVT